MWPFRKHFVTPPTHPLPDFIEIEYLESLYANFIDQWHLVMIYVTSLIHGTSKCDTHDMCPTVSHCDEMTQTIQKKQKNINYLEMKNMWYTVTPSKNLAHLGHQKSWNSLDPPMTAEGTVGAPTCFYYKCTDPSPLRLNPNPCMRQA
jgi:hypothetical protein